jgi:hypothetical protein
MKGVGLVEQGSRKCFRVFCDGYFGHQGRWPSKIRDLTEIRLRALAFENTSRKVKARQRLRVWMVGMALIAVSALAIARKRASRAYYRF